MSNSSWWTVIKIYVTLNMNYEHLDDSLCFLLVLSLVEIQVQYFGLTVKLMTFQIYLRYLSLNASVHT